MKKSKTTFLEVRNIILLLCFTICLMLTSCADNSKNLTKGTPMAFSDAELRKMLANKEEYKGKRFSVEGFLTYSAGFTVYTNRLQTVSVKQALNSDYQDNIAISMPWEKDGKNSVYLPQDTDNDEPFFYDNEGKPLTSKDKVIVSFSLKDTEVFPTDIRLDRAK